MIIYNKFCNNCKKEYFHKILATSLKRGVKLCCLKCLKSRWYSYDKIKKYEVRKEF